MTQALVYVAHLIILHFAFHKRPFINRSNAWTPHFIKRRHFENVCHLLETPPQVFDSANLNSSWAWCGNSQLAVAESAVSMGCTRAFAVVLSLSCVVLWGQSSCNYLIGIMCHEMCGKYLRWKNIISFILDNRWSSVVMTRFLLPLRFFPFD